jgi:hypothetical protein
MLETVEQVAQRIREGAPLLLAGEEQALRSVPQGHWIAGRTPYFMDRDGGACSRERIYVTELPGYVKNVGIRGHTAETLPEFLVEAPDNGFTTLILPAQSAAHAAYAHDASGYRDIFVNPVMGWIAGVHVPEIGIRRAKAVNGEPGSFISEGAVAMHVPLPPDWIAELDIVNVFKPGTGEAIYFESDGFQAKTCQVGGRTVNLGSFLTSVAADTRLPITADYNGSVINVSIQSVDPVSGAVKFYALVFQGVAYRLAAPLDDYLAAFEASAGNSSQPVFSCNCIVNYLYSNLEGRKTGSAAGPITFGEIANLLLNQTMVRLFIRSTLNNGQC